MAALGAALVPRLLRGFCARSPLYRDVVRGAGEAGLLATYVRSWS
jgi:hypothetical protein